jgi:hypothetical protein
VTVVRVFGPSIRRTHFRMLEMPLGETSSARVNWSDMRRAHPAASFMAVEVLLSGMVNMRLPGGSR